MLVTRETDYAVRCFLCPAKEQDRIASVSEIAEQMRLPKSFLEKTLQRLIREGIVESIRGVNGGFRLLKKPDHITLLEVLNSIQDIVPVNICAIDERLCSKPPIAGSTPFGLISGGKLRDVSRQGPFQACWKQDRYPFKRQLHLH